MARAIAIAWRKEAAKPVRGECRLPTNSGDLGKAAPTVCVMRIGTVGPLRRAGQRWVRVPQFVIRSMAAADALAIAQWRYPAPYSFYDVDADPDDLAELLD